MNSKINSHPISWLNIPGYKGETWNPIIGCNKESEGCENCYAERMANRLASNPKTAAKYARITQDGKWTGILSFDADSIYKPFQWKTPRAIFVCSMGDIFHPLSEIKWIDQVMITAALNPRHLFIFLTKRPKAMAEYFATGKEELLERWENILYDYTEDFCICDEDGDPSGPACYIYNRANGNVKSEHNGWPYNNIWLGVTAENQEMAEKRIPILLSIPAAKRFVSIEPMLGAIDPWHYEKQNGFVSHYPGIGIDWVIVGGESGPKARPMHPDWVRSVLDQCAAAEVPFFFKQWGEWLPSYDFGERLDELIRDFPKCRISQNHEFPDGIQMVKVGRKAAGNLVDGKEYHQFPKI